MDKYINNVIEKLKVLMPECEFRTEEVTKNNGVKKTGLVIMNPASRNPACPVFYITKDDATAFTPDDLARRIKKAYESEAEKGITFDLSKFNDYEDFVKKNITFQIVSRSRNQYSERPSIPITDDLQVIFRIYLGKSASVPITNEHLKIWGNPSMDELMECAVKNSAVLDKAVFTTMEDMLFSLATELKDDVNQKEKMEIAEMIERNVAQGDCGMYILTTEGQNDSAILYENVMEKIREQLGDVYIIPSSIHETIIISKEMGDQLGVEQLVAMIKDVNSTVVAPVEILSDIPLVYDKDGLHSVNISQKAFEEII